ncbi:MAG: hypothetical protein R3321_04755 [Nitrososphaeraceae archaeon]|nr:hypothetical protein [Nitrososphaeraceae archaeon]
MDIIPHEDFSHTVIIGETEILFRELMGKDIYYIELWREDDKDQEFLQSSDFLHSMIERLSVDPYRITQEDLLDFLAPDYRKLLEWFCENRLQDRLLSLNNWLTLCFHLSKQRWTSDLEWFENQPLIKIIQMSDIQAKFHEQVNKSMKESSKKK